MDERNMGQEKFGTEKHFSPDEPPTGGGVDSSQPADETSPVQNTEEEKSYYHPAVEKALREGYLKNFDDLAEKYKDVYTAESMRELCEKMIQIQESALDIQSKLGDYSDTEIGECRQRMNELAEQAKRILAFYDPLLADVNEKELNGFGTAGGLRQNSNLKLVPDAEINRVRNIETHVSERMKNQLLFQMYKSFYIEALERIIEEDQDTNSAETKKDVLEESLGQISSDYFRKIVLKTLAGGMKIHDIIKSVSLQKDALIEGKIFKTEDYQTAFNKRLEVFFDKIRKNAEEPGRYVTQKNIDDWKKEAMVFLEENSGLLNPEEKVLFDNGYYADLFEEKFKEIRPF